MQAESELNQSIGQASALDDTLNGTIQSAEQVKDALCGSIETAGTAKTQLDDSISSASTSKSELDNSIAQAGTAKNELDGSIAQAGTVKGELDSSIATAGQTKTALDESIATGELAEFKDDFTSHLNDYATHIESELQPDHTVVILPDGVKNEFSGNKMIQRAKEIVTSNSIVVSGLCTPSWQIPDHTAVYFQKLLNPNAPAPSTDRDHVYVDGYSSGRWEFKVPGEAVAGFSNIFYMRVLNSRTGILDTDDDVTKKAKFQTWLRANPITIRYKLAEPVEIPLPENMSPNTRELARLSEQVDKLTAAIIAMGGTIV